MRFPLHTAVHHLRTRLIQSSVAALVLSTVHMALARVVSAQQAQTVTPATGAAVARARAMADAGDADKARMLLDSLVAAVSRESIDAGEALYWRASLAEGSPNAERDWKRLVVEIPQSARVPDALLRLSELDMTHNNTLLARQHAKRVISDYPDAPERSRAMIVLAQSYFTENDAPHACGVLTVVRKEAPLSAVEVRMQADEMQQQCRNVREVAMGAAPDPTPAPAIAPLTSMLPTVPPLRDATGRDAAARDAALREATARDATARDAAARDAATNAAARSAAVRDSIAAKKADVARAAADARDAELARKATFARDAAAKKAAAARAAAEARDSADAREAAAARRAEIESEAVAAREAAARETARENATRKVVSPARAVTPPAPAVPTTGRWTIQVAAYDTRAQADALVKKLIANDLAAHTVGARKPFRVQVGRFETRTDAADALTVMKTKGQNGFISEWAKR